MISIINKTIFQDRLLRITVIFAVMVMAALVPLISAEAEQKKFSSPEQAVAEAVAAVRNNADAEFIAIFGPEGEELISSGDAVSDQQARERFVNAYDEKNSLIAEGENMVLVIGSEEWPFPIPLIKDGEAWSFDTLQGKEEILNRRIGRNELESIQVCLAIVDAQREYALKDPDTDGIPTYAENFKSSAGQKDGLYWETPEGEDPSPLGPAFAKAREEGYDHSQPSDEPSPFHGYFYRILKSQGESASGGAYEYVVNGKMIGGFAVVAYPAQYENSGVMTFIVNHDGIVYQKDLGEETTQTAKSMNAFDPDESWTKVDDSSLE